MRRYDVGAVEGPQICKAVSSTRVAYWHDAGDELSDPGGASRTRQRNGAVDFLGLPCDAKSPSGPLTD